MQRRKPICTFPPPSTFACALLLPRTVPIFPLSPGQLLLTLHRGCSRPASPAVPGSFAKHLKHGMATAYLPDNNPQGQGFKSTHHTYFQSIAVTVADIWKLTVSTQWFLLSAPPAQAANPHAPHGEASRQAYKGAPSSVLATGRVQRKPTLCNKDTCIRGS